MLATGLLAGWPAIAAAAEQGETMPEIVAGSDAPDSAQLVTIQFYERRDRYRGSAATFLTPATIRARHAMRLADLIRGARGIRVEYAGTVAIARGRDGCALSVWADGRLIKDIFPGPPPGQSAFAARNPVRYSDDPARYPGLDLFQVNTILSVEIYPSPADTPTVFQSLTGNCGTLVLWTR